MTAEEQLTQFLHQSIPLTVAMQLRVEAVEDHRVRIRAPMAPNRNHHGTAFGGSLATLGLVTGWAAIHHAMEVGALDAALVVRHSELDYLLPVTADLVAECALPAEAWERFSTTLRAGRRARLEVVAHVREGEQDAVRVQASYVATPRRPP